MKRALAGIICFVTVLTGVSGCGVESRTAAASAQTAPAQTQTSQAAGTASEDVGMALAEEPLLQLEEAAVPAEGIHIAVVAKSTEGGYWKSMKNT